MKISAELPSVINLVKKDEEYQKRTRAAGEAKNEVTDVVSVENKAASRSQVKNVDEARVLISDVMKEIEKVSSSVHTLNQSRISQLVS